LSVEQAKICDKVQGLVEYARLKTCPPNGIGYSEIACIAIVEITAGIVGITTRLIDVSGQKTGELHRADGPTIGSVENLRIDRSEVVVSILRQL
jgi:hypothetical protein